MPNEMQIPDGLMNFLIVIAVCYALQTMVSFGYLVMEIVRDDRSARKEGDLSDYSALQARIEAQRRELAGEFPDDTEWETRA